MASRKNASGNRFDVGWQHGIDVDKNSRKVLCKYCQFFLLMYFKILYNFFTILQFVFTIQVCV